ncbi:MAG: hypothetical protein R3246_05255, partial [Acidimicrobiia bacterium]|nr:hypothetical protein [Acidimicrobiia bacterium]
LVEVEADDEAGRLFLARPEGWETRLQELAEAREEAQVRRERNAEAAELARLRVVNEELSQRLEEEREHVASLQRALEDDDRIVRLKRRVAELERMLHRKDEDLARAAAQHAELEALLDEADDRISLLRSRAGDAPPEAVDRPRLGAFGRGDPVETARLLDELTEALRVFRPRPQQPVARPVLRLPQGVRPDLPEAVEWLLRLDRRVTLVVDGHNVAHDLAAPDRATRDRIVSAVGRIRRLADGPITAVVFFDTPEGEETYRTSRVAVRYALQADDSIHELVASTEEDCVVVTTDRELRGRVAELGAVVLWGSALTEWIRQPRAAKT